MKPQKIIFLGTPKFAVPSLEALNQSPHRVLQVITQPDRPKGRGKKIEPPPIKKKAKALGIDIMQPSSINSLECIDRIQSFHPDFLVVVAFGQLLKQPMLSIPSRCVLNVHPSLLPEYRGPAPIQWSIIHGCSQTGISIMKLDEGLDTGDVYQVKNVSIKPDETAGELDDRLSHIGAKLLLNTIEKIIDGSISLTSQNNALATYAPRLSKKDGLIQWQLPTQSIINFIRGMNPWPGAFTFIENKRFKIFRAEKINDANEQTPGMVVDGFPDELWISTGDGILSILEIQNASGKRMPISDYLRGNKISPGTFLG